MMEACPRVFRGDSFQEDEEVVRGHQNKWEELGFHLRTLFPKNTMNQADKAFLEVHDILVCSLALFIYSQECLNFTPNQDYHSGPRVELNGAQ